MNTATPTLSRRMAVTAALAAPMLATMPASSQSRAPTPEATIRVDGAVTTLVNTLKVEPDDRPTLVALLREGIDSLFSKKPGWISTAVLVDRSGKQVIVYSQWRDASDIDAFRKDPALQPYFQRIAALAKQDVFSGDVTYCLHA